MSNNKLVGMTFAGIAVLTLGAASTASAATVHVTSGGIYQPGTLHIVGPSLDVNAYSTAIELTGTVNGTPQVRTLYTFCVDLFHSISVGIDNTHDIVTGNGDAQAALNLNYHAALLTVDSNGPTSGVSGSPLTMTQIAEIGGLAIIGGNLISTDALDLSNKLDAIQAAIWSIEYPAYSITSGNVTVQGYIASYIANAAATQSHRPVVAIYGSNGQGLLPTGGVPEPASWALMLTGVGLMGAGLRRRRAAVALSA